VPNPDIRAFLETSFRGVLEDWNCALEEFGGEEDHVHLLIAIHPALKISELINYLKSATSKKTPNHFRDHIAQFYWKPISGTVPIMSAV
jgi:putative transposase